MIMLPLFIVVAIVLAYLVATVELCESNNGEAITHNISNINYGSDDSPNLVPATYPITRGDTPAGCSYEKYVRLHVTAMGGSNAIDNIQIWLSNLGGGWMTGEHCQTNLKTGGYSAETYASPSQTCFDDQSCPEADPGAANLGCGGSLAGQITAAGYSDYWKSQEHTTVATEPGDVNTKTWTIQYDEQ